jgi:hypothetical protein
MEGVGVRLWMATTLLAGLSSCAVEDPRPTGSPAGPDALDVRAVDHDGDGKVLLRGRVIDNVPGCEVDAACLLRLEVDGSVTSVVYHFGEWPPCENAAAVSQGTVTRKGERVEVHAGISEGNQLTTCTSSEFYIRPLTDSTPASR